MQKIKSFQNSFCLLAINNQYFQNIPGCMYKIKHTGNRERGNNNYMVKACEWIIKNNFELLNPKSGFFRIIFL